MLVDPSTACVGKTVEVGYIRLDVQERRAVKHIYVGEVEAAALDSFNPNDRQADMVGAVRASNGKDAVGLVFQERLSCRCYAIRFVKVVEQERVTETIEIFQALNVFRIDFRPPFGIRLEAALYRNVGMFMIRGMDDTDRLDSDFISHVLFIPPPGYVEARCRTRA